MILSRSEIISAAPLILMGAGLLTALSSLIVGAESISAGIAVSATLTVLAGSLIAKPRSQSRAWLLAAPGALLTGTCVAILGDAPGSIAHGLCGTAIAATTMAGLGLILGKQRGHIPEKTFVPGVLEHSKFAASSTDSPLAGLEVVSPTGVFEGPPPLQVLFDDLLCEQEEVPDDLEEPRQHWSRLLHENEDRLEGMMIADLQPGQKHCYLHVPFIPFFEVQPTACCECESEDLADVDAELDLIHPYGARLSIRRRGDCSDQSRVRIHLFVTGARRLPRAA